MDRLHMKIFSGLLFLLLITFLIYYPATQAGLLMDDNLAFSEDPLMQTPDGLFRIWFHPEEHNGFWPYIPITRSTFWLEHQWSDGDVPTAHIINIGLHALTAILLWLALRHFAIPGAWWVGLLFAVHPVYVQSVAWITERKNLVAGVFYVLTFWCYLHFDQKRISSKNRTLAWGGYGLALLVFGCALLSKTSTIMIPVLLIVARFWLNRSWERADFLRLLPFFLMAFGMGLLRVWYELTYFGAGGAEFTRSFVERLMVAGHIPFFYLQKLLIPYPLIFHYPKWSIDSGQITQFLPLLSIVLILGLLAWKFRNGGRPWLLAFLAFGIALFPVMGFFNNAWTRFSYVTDHWVHLPSIAILILIVQVCGALSRDTPSTGLANSSRLIQSYGSFLPLCFILPFAFLTWNQAQLYRSDKVLWETTLKHNPNAWGAHYDLGSIHLEQGDAETALSYFNRAIELNSNAADVLTNRGTVYFELKQYQQALQDYDRALQINPAIVEVYNNRGLLYAERQHYEQALAEYNQALVYDPTVAAIYFNRGLVRSHLQQYEGALQDYTEALTRDPNYAKAYFQRGVLYWNLTRNPQQACPDFQQACQLGYCADLRTDSGKSICSESQ